MHAHTHTEQSFCLNALHSQNRKKKITYKLPTQRQTPPSESLHWTHAAAHAVACTRSHTHTRARTRVVCSLNIAVIESPCYRLCCTALHVQYAYRVPLRKEKNNNAALFFFIHQNTRERLKGTITAAPAVPDTWYRSDYVWQCVEHANHILYKKRKHS